MGWIPTGGATDADAIHDNVAAEIAALTLVTAASGDHVLIEDASDSNNKKRVAASDFLAAGSSIAESAKGSRSSTVQSIANSTFVKVQFDTEEWDDNGLIDLGTNNTRITIQTAGKYQINAGMRWAANTNAVRAIQIFKNNTTILRGLNLEMSTDAANQNGDGSVSVIDEAAINDFYEIRVFQNSGASLNLSADIRNSLEVARVA